MKRFISLLVIVVLTAAAGVCFGADAVPAAAPLASGATTTFQKVLAWMTQNQVVLGGLLVAILDFIFSINPEWKSNSILHLLYLAAQNKKTPPSEPPAA